MLCRMQNNLFSQLVQRRILFSLVRIIFISSTTVHCFLIALRVSNESDVTDTLTALTLELHSIAMITYYIPCITKNVNYILFVNYIFYGRIFRYLCVSNESNDVMKI